MNPETIIPTLALGEFTLEQFQGDRAVGKSVQGGSCLAQKAHEAAIPRYSKPGIALADRFNHSVRLLVTMLTLCPAVVACGQAPTTSNLPPGAASNVPFGSVLPGVLGMRQRLQQLRASSNFPAAASSAQTPATAIKTGRYQFVNITIPNAIGLDINGINNGGMLVGSYQDADFKEHGFLWSNGKVQTIDYPGAVSTSFSSINNRGILVGAYLPQNSGYRTIVTYSLANSTWTVLPDIPGGWPIRSAEGITDEGVVAGCAVQSYPARPQQLSWFWHPDTQTYSYFTAPAASEASTCPSATSYSGDVIGSMGLAYNASVATFLRTHQGEYETISPPSNLPGTLFYPSGINDSDTIVGMILLTATGDSAFVRTSDGVITLVKRPGFDETFVSGINDSGVLCGVSLIGGGPSFAFVAYPEN